MALICLPKTCPSHVSLLFAFPISTISYDHTADVMICRYGPELHKLPGPDTRQLMMSIRIVKSYKTFRRAILLSLAPISELCMMKILLHGTCNMATIGLFIWTELM